MKHIVEFPISVTRGDGRVAGRVIEGCVEVEN